MIGFPSSWLYWFCEKNMAMNKSTNFSGQPIAKQLLKFISPDMVSLTATGQNSDRYYKRSKTYDHLVTMLNATLSGVGSLREHSTILLACEGRMGHLNLEHFPKRSTLSDANRNRSSGVFAEIYHGLFDKYRSFLSDSSPLS